MKVFCQKREEKTKTIEQRLDENDLKRTYWRANKGSSNQARALLGRSNIGTDQPTNRPTDQLTN
jgi:hypothetical protein